MHAKKLLERIHVETVTASPGIPLPYFPDQ